MAVIRSALAALTLIVTASSGLDAAEQRARAILDVPYLTQQGDLCGGAAVAMVLRYWGDRRAVAQDFATLIDSSRNGIPAGVLEQAVRSRGWRTTVLPPGSSTASLSAAVDAAFPVITLIEVGPATFHYVVVVSVTDREVVIHDPAVRPFDSLPLARFVKAWNAAGTWGLVVEPHAAAPNAVLPVNSMSPDGASLSTPVNRSGSLCADLVSHAVVSARAGRPIDAERTLKDATSRCPTDAAAWRELAGLRFTQSRWSDARQLAARALQLDSEDASAWRILGTSHFMEDQQAQALVAWNRVLEPELDTIRVHGADRLRHGVIIDRLGLETRRLLSPAAFERAGRRAAAVPALSEAQLRYDPDADGRVDVDVTVRERALFPKGWMDWAGIGGRALLVDELEIEINSPTGSGERIDLEWGWKQERPRWALRLSAPLPGPVRWLMTFETSDSRQAFSVPATGAGEVLREQRRRTGFELGDWATNRFRWRAGVAHDRLPQATFVAFNAGLDSRWLRDTLAIDVAATSWTSRTGAFSAGDIKAYWRQRPLDIPRGFHGAAGLALRSEGSPLTVWPGADITSSREALLRGHRLLTDGVVTGRVFGRRLAFASLTYEHPLYVMKFGTVNIAGFVDSARAWQRPNDAAGGHVDIGVGLRLHDSPMGSVRLDIGYGLRDGGSAFSAAFVRPWPGR